MCPALDLVRLATSPVTHTWEGKAPSRALLMRPANSATVNVFSPAEAPPEVGEECMLTSLDPDREGRIRE